MKYSFILLLYLVAGTVQAQDLKISYESESRGNGSEEFTLSGHPITITDAAIEYAPDGVSADVTRSGLAVALNAKGISVFDVDGEKVYQAKYKVSQEDDSHRLYIAENGAFVLRENVANFLFYDATGKILHSISNSSRSTEGESISEFEADAAFKTRILYNPQIIRNGQKGSRARIVRSNGTTRDIYNSQDKAIRFVEVSDNGQFIAVNSYSGGSEDEVHITDRFGNDINTISFDQNVVGVKFSEDGRYVTVYSNSRVAAYEMISGERVGSASFRTPLRIAQYFPEDGTIIALTADESSSVLSNVEIHLIDIEARKIVRKSLDEELGITQMIEPELERIKSNKYSLSGLSKELVVTF